MNQMSETKNPLLRIRDGDYDICMKNDGMDYRRLVRACIDENIDQPALIREKKYGARFSMERNGVKADLAVLAFMNPKRLVLRMETEGRKFVVKRAYMGSPGFRRFFPNAIGLTYFTRIMKKVNAAVRDGCDATQDYFLVAERWLSPFRSEVWTLMEYLEGGLLEWRPDSGPYKPALRETALSLLRHNLTMDDVAPGNFIVGEDGSVRAIDLSCRPFSRWQKASMTWKLNRVYNLGLPVRGWAEKIVCALYGFRYRNDKKRFQQR